MKTNENGVEFIHKMFKEASTTRIEYLPTFKAYEMLYVALSTYGATGILIRNHIGKIKIDVNQTFIDHPLATDCILNMAKTLVHLLEAYERAFGLEDGLNFFVDQMQGKYGVTLTHTDTR